MSDPIVTLEPTDLTVEPGGQIRTELTVRNPGTVVEGYQIEVLGETPDQGPPAWAQVYPPELRVFPKESGTATIVFAPPSAGATAGGKFAFGVRVASSLDNERTAVAEGDLEVGRVFGLQATITPMTSTGRWRGYHVINYTNWGNTPVRLRLKASDPDERLGFFLRPDEVELPLGGKAEARLTVRTRKPFLRGQQTRLPFEVAGEQEGVPRPQPAHPMVSDPSRPVVNGALMQKPIIGKAVVMLAVACVALLAGALVLLFKTPQKKQTFEVPGTPDAPTALTAKTVKNGAIQLDWRPPQQVSGYKVKVLPGTVCPKPACSAASVLPGATQIASAKIDDGAQGRFLTTALGLAPATRYCFELESLRGATPSRDSTTVCQTTPAAPKPATSGSPTATGSGGNSSGGNNGGNSAGGSSSGSSAPSGSAGPSGSSTRSGPPPAKIAQGQWILLCYPLRYDSEPNAEALVAADALNIDKFAPADVLHSTDYPVFYINRLQAKPFWAVFFGPYDSQSEGQQASDLVRANHITCVFTKPLGG